MTGEPSIKCILVTCSVTFNRGVLSGRQQGWRCGILNGEGQGGVGLIAAGVRGHECDTGFSGCTALIREQGACLGDRNTATIVCDRDAIVPNVKPRCELIGIAASIAFHDLR